ncbi:Rieske 2Fe-2S domain-containing protein [Variovorax paradoxus]|uniref:Rieske 2Fe-2S domain-containing protein n=1 Tax=Variovorax paradoxus TaxID=34073 RepID=UPI00277F0E3C|nr:Rieske 2Fe-2S domain-containing protein [Variovorax paradoxus]MDQ0590476.1 phenylpropionate dioxygenase-like ring-hydroxylating dioxygenase large terminal subunit [Variovorax paradoxus]
MEPPSPRALPLPDGFRPPNCTFAEGDWPVLARQWFPVARVDAVAAKPRQLTLLNLRLAIYRMPNGIRIARDVCPHRGLPLSAGRIEGDELVCAYHGLRFGSDGLCRKVPEKLAPKAPECFSVALFPSIEHLGLIWTCLIPHGEPKLPEILSGTEDIDANFFASSIKLQIESWMGFEKLEFSSNGISIESSHQLSLRNFVLDEYRRLFESM